MGQKLNSAFGHCSGHNPSDRKAGILFAVFGRDWPPHVDQRQDGKTGVGQPAMFTGRIGAAEGGEMNADVSCNTFLELAGKRRVLGGGEDLDIAPPEHGAAIAGAGRRRRATASVGLGGKWRKAKSATLQRFGGGGHCRHEMRDMIKKDLGFSGELRGHGSTRPI